ncbi:hypothetical protein C8Q78DRAFT_28662 [Trametes maxima]|nr:hypothetical protein C8Q78DRAFT_28662 [Trametes maxima]
MVHTYFETGAAKTSVLRLAPGTHPPAPGYRRMRMVEAEQGSGACMMDGSVTHSPRGNHATAISGEHTWISDLINISLLAWPSREKIHRVNAAGAGNTNIETRAPVRCVKCGAGRAHAGTGRGPLQMLCLNSHKVFQIAQNVRNKRPGRGEKGHSACRMQRLDAGQFPPISDSNRDISILMGEQYRISWRRKRGRHDSQVEP